MQRVPKTGNLTLEAPGTTRRLWELGEAWSCYFNVAFSYISCLELQFHEAFLNIASIECDTVERNY